MKKLFTVPQDRAVSEKEMLRVLVCTACSILICMGCIIGSAWAWFAVGLESNDNALVVGSFDPAISVTGAGGEILPDSDGNYPLTVGHYTVKVSTADSEVGGYLTVQFAKGTQLAPEKYVTARIPGPNDTSDIRELSFTLKVYEDCALVLSQGWGIPAPPTLSDGDEVTFGTATIDEEDEKSEDETAGGEKPEDEIPENQKPEDENTEGEKSEGESTEGEKPEGESTEGEGTEGEKPEGESTEGEGTEGEGTEATE